MPPIDGVIVVQRTSPILTRQQAREPVHADGQVLFIVTSDSLIQLLSSLKIQSVPIESKQRNQESYRPPGLQR